MILHVTHGRLNGHGLSRVAYPDEEGVPDARGVCEDRFVGPSHVHPAYGDVLELRKSHSHLAGDHVSRDS